jgi:hypothetical protein
MSRIIVILIIAGSFLQGCVSGRSSFNPQKKYSLHEVEKDYSVFQNVLQESHPGLYWYTSKDSMDYFFLLGASQLKDSMTEPEFRKILAYVTAKINCGHTSVRPSKYYSRYLDTFRTKTFPLGTKLWQDTMAVVINLNRRDSILKRGTVVKKINGQSVNLIVDSLFNYLSADGYNKTHKYQSLSNRGSFGSLYTSIFGLSEKYFVDYIDSAGHTESVTIPVYNPSSDSSLRTLIRSFPPLPKLTRRERKQMQLPQVRSLRIDPANHTAFMDLNSFGRGFHLKKFFRQSFRSLRKNKIGYLVVDVRGNGGGSVINSTFISRFISDHRFKIADSLYAIAKKNHYGRYIQNNFWNRLFLFFFTRKKSDGHYHFGYYERHWFGSKKNNRFSGKTFVLMGGNSFSATTLFIDAINKQENVITVGEETGGGAYGNTAWLIPDVTLPHTRIRFRLPLFRLVVDKNIPKNGRGVQPEIEVDPSVGAIRRNADYKLDKVMELIRAEKARRGDPWH